jgi:hypothetical protein
VAVVRRHVWRTLCSDCETGARVAPPSLCNLSFLRFHRHRHTVVSTCCFTGNGTGWCENSTLWKLHKRVRAHGRVAPACLWHCKVCANGVCFVQPFSCNLQMQRNQNKRSKDGDRREVLKSLQHWQMHVYIYLDRRDLLNYFLSTHTHSTRWRVAFTCVDRPFVLQQ